ncbi:MULTISPECIES: hypothetical protein [Acidithiobacillus]|uniref:hypothetical protein n=1 Tax=Acidithiobacillus TaxID=119977 RepID=UPI00094B1974|nr:MULTISPECIES: hypothetical protein [Acidithiobacillus]MDD5279750.1 hypothetical protein [Acidithiobacillus sp.]
MKKSIFTISITCCLLFYGTSNADVIKPGWWSTGHGFGYCVEAGNAVPTLRFLELEVRKTQTGASQYTTCNHGKWLTNNTYGYQAKLTCKTMGINGQYATQTFKVTFHKKDKNNFYVKINGEYFTKYKSTRKKCIISKHPWAYTELNPGVPIPLRRQNMLLKKLHGGQ